MQNTSTRHCGPGNRTIIARIGQHLLLASCCLLCACVPIQISRPVFKVGLLAPFEGKGRATGYEALYAVKLALQERNTSGGVVGWSVELLALDNDAQVLETGKQARVLAADPDVVHALVVVEAPDQPAAEDALRPIALAFNLLPAHDAGNGAAASATFIESYRNISGGITPGDLAVRTYAATQELLAGLERRIRADGRAAR